jgi:hypothetical protein
MDTISDIADVLAALTEVTKPYQLGIQLKIDVSKLKTIEENYSKDIDRQKTEVIEYWLRNSPDASWTTLANAVERMGGHAKLVKTLRGKETKSEEEKQNVPAICIKAERVGGCAISVDVMEREMSKNKEMKRRVSVYYEWTPSMENQYCGSVRRKVIGLQSSLNTCIQCNILLLGKMGHGTSTVGNRMTWLNCDGLFKINDQRCPQTAKGSSLLKSASQYKDYRIDIYDHSGLFEGASSISELSSAVPKELNLVIFVLKRGCDFDESEVAILKSVVSEWRISGISALVLTHCERLSEEERGEMIEQFEKHHPSIAELMGKGILVVGFPDSSHIPPGSPLSQRVEEDEANLRKLIYSCDEPVRLISQFIPQSENRRPPQNENRRRLCCSIL